MKIFDFKNQNVAEKKPLKKSKKIPNFAISAKSERIKGRKSNIQPHYGVAKPNKHILKPYKHRFAP